jgi:hypothetical protein
MDWRGTLQADPEFTLRLGIFHAAWVSIDMTIDFAIGKFLNLAHEDAQILTSGMMYGTKIRILKSLVRKSAHKNKAQIIGSLNKLQNESKRNVFAHSYMASDAVSVTFLERSSGGNYLVTKHRFTKIQWNSHVTNFTLVGKEFWDALDVPDSDLEEFAMALMRAAKS